MDRHTLFLHQIEALNAQCGLFAIQIKHMCLGHLQTRSLDSEPVLFSSLDHGSNAISGDTPTGGLLLFHHVGDGSRHGFEQRLQLPFLTQALHQFDPGSHRTFTCVFEGVERAARHAHALRQVGLGSFFLNPQAFQPLRQNPCDFFRRGKSKV
jgi:hypothetical protein